MLRRRAKTDGNVAQSLEPVVKAFQYRHPLIKAQLPTKRETHAKSELKKGMTLAQKNGVAPAPAARTTSPAPAQASGTNMGATQAAPPAPSTAISPVQVASTPVAPVTGPVQIANAPLVPVSAPAQVASAPAAPASTPAAPAVVPGPVTNGASH
jgi:hypothetical protein